MHKMGSFGADGCFVNFCLTNTSAFFIIRLKIGKEVYSSYLVSVIESLWQVETDHEKIMNKTMELSLASVIGRLNKSLR